MFKIKHRLLELCFEDFFQENSYKRTRGNLYKLVSSKTRTKYRQNFFVCSIIKHWNRLSSFDIDATSINLFQNNVDNYFRKMNIW